MVSFRYECSDAFGEWGVGGFYYSFRDVYSV